MVKLNEEQERVSHLLTDTVTLLCRNGLQFNTEMKVQGLLGITLDNEVFIVQIDKTFAEVIGADVVSSQNAGEEVSESASSQGGMSDSPETPTSKKKRMRRKRRSRESEQAQSDPETPDPPKSRVFIKRERVEEEEEDLIVMDSDSKANLQLQHDKDSMRESYGVSFDTTYGNMGTSPRLKHLNNSSVQNNQNLPGSDAGCSTWDASDPLAALVASDSSSMVASPGDNTLDQQTMSTFGSSMWNVTFPLGGTPPGNHGIADQDEKRFVCPMQCGKSYYDKRHLVQHADKYHGVTLDKEYFDSKNLDNTKYVCNVDGCGKKFGRRDTVLCHKRQVHKIAVPTRKSPGLLMYEPFLIKKTNSF